MAAEREARFLMRQRGAGARDFNDLSFDLSLPNAPRSASKTPVRARTVTPRSRRSVAKTASPALLPDVPEERAQTAASSQYVTPSVVITRADEEGSVVKRRRVADGLDTVVEEPSPDIAGEDGVDDVEPADIEDEVVEPVPTSTVKKRRKRRSILPRSKRRSGGNLESAASREQNATAGQDEAEGENETLVESAAVQTEAAQEEEEGVAEDGAEDSEVQDEHDEAEGGGEQDAAEHVEETPISTLKKAKPARRKRKSVGLPSKRRRSSQTAPVRSTRHANSSTDKDVEGPREEELEEEIASDGEAEVSGSGLQKKRGRSRNSLPEDEPSLTMTGDNRPQQPRLDSPDQGEVPSRKKFSKNSKEPLLGESSKASRQRRKSPPRTGRTEGSGSDTAAQSQQKKRRKNPSQQKRQSSQDAAESNKIEITVQRMSHYHRLNFNPDEDDDLAGPGAFPKKKTPNAIDVLAQICREIIGKNIQALKNSAERERGSRRAEWTRKREVVKKFGDELEGRLLMMTTALDHNYALNAKLRHANKNRIKLRDQLLDLRRQREELELKKDEIRRRNELASRTSNNQHELNALLNDISLAAERGREAQERERERDSVDEDEEGLKPNLAFRLQRVAETVSSADGRVGLLEKVKNFNRQLEEVIAQL